jgi:hypothetical protein
VGGTESCVPDDHDEGLQDSGCENVTDELAFLREYDAMKWSTEEDKTVEM